MERTAKLFKKGRHQAVVLPEEFAFETESVYIRRDEEGNVVLTPKAEQVKTWDNFSVVGKHECTRFIFK